MAVDHVDDLQFGKVQLVGGGGAAVLYHDHAETFVGEATHGRADALVGEDTGNDHVVDLHVAQQQAQVGAIGGAPGSAPAETVAGQPE